MAKSKSNKQAPSPGKSRALEVIDRLRKNAETRKLAGLISIASEYHTPFDLRRASNVISLDLATGGGIPAGGITEIAGPEGVGKNYLANQYIAEVQHQYGEDAAIAVATIEFQYDKDFARKCGVQIAYDDYEIALLQQERARQGKEPLKKAEVELLQQQQGAFAIIQGEPEHVLDTVVEMVRSNAFQIILLDSLDALLTEDEAEKDLADAPKIGSTATLQTRFMKKLYGAYAGRSEDGRMNETSIITLRQIRANTNAHAFSRKWKIAGAHAVKHTNLVQIVLQRGQKMKDGSKVVGKLVDWSLEKGKAGCHDGPSGTYKYYYDPPHIDVLDDLMSVLYQHKMVRKVRGQDAYRITIDGEVLAEGSQEQLFQQLGDDRALYDTIVAMLYEINGIQHVRHR